LKGDIRLTVDIDPYGFFEIEPWKWLGKKVGPDLGG
jgi:hypothetical protein